jgi:hypothetical protein
VDRVAEPSRVWDGAIGDQMRAIRGLPSGQLVFDLFAGRGRKSDDAELATTISCRKMAVDLSNRFDRCRRACRGYDQRDEPAIGLLAFLKVRNRHRLHPPDQITTLS